MRAVMIQPPVSRAQKIIVPENHASTIQVVALSRHAGTSIVVVDGSTRTSRPTGDVARRASWIAIGAGWSGPVVTNVTMGAIAMAASAAQESTYRDPAVRSPPSEVRTAAYRPAIIAP